MSQSETAPMDKVYQPAEVEPRWYAFWEANQMFGARPNPDRKPFTIVIPPPNITGSLHMGHALNNTIQDILIRMRRMQGFETLWVPGTDHAGIATQAVVEKTIAKEGKTRFDLGRDAFIDRVWKWRDESGRTIVGQLKRLGASCDWSRERFTMDEQCTRAVREAFYRLYKKGCIYRGKYIVNWCPRCLTALSDLEVEHETDKNGKIYHVRYPIDGEGFITIATTRPETILADTAIAVSPRQTYTDAEGNEQPNPWSHLVGKQATLPLVGRRLPIIADDHVELGFGTGALKVTPAHDANDFAIGQRHGLETVVCMNDKGVMSADFPDYAGLDRFKCRTKIVEDLEREGFLVKIEPYEVALGTCYRCHTVLEPYLSDQWFMRMEEIARPAIEVVKQGRVRFHPSRFSDLYLRWMENLRDWCIGRQLWWGHRVPVWTCANGHADAYREDPGQCSQCDSTALVQDSDVLDTWFSSALWPLSTLGWPDETPDLAYFYPTNVLSTDRGILYLWVARMIMTGLEFKDEIPFSDVYIHATVLTKDGRRMSKSLGTGVDPLGLFDQYGTDATRFGLAWMTGQGQDIKFSEERIQMSRNFANKIWNAVRLALRFVPAEGETSALSRGEGWSLYDRWIVSRLQAVTDTVTQSADRFEFDGMTRVLYDFFWDEVCDWYLELVKPVFYDRADAAEQRETGRILDHVLSTFLRLLHPLMPFITEECWHALPGQRGSIVTATWPTPQPALRDAEAETRMGLVMDVVRALRNMRAEVGARDEMDAVFVFEDNASRETLMANHDALRRLAHVGAARVVASLDENPPAALSTRCGGGEVFLPLPASMDLSKEVERLSKEQVSIEATIEGARRKLENPAFVEKAKPEVVARERARLAELEETRQKVTQRLEMMRGLTR
ncbi:MAG: valine--tRNA ligase [Proteobacteria bacterium]|nr:valine--tRNA ligase [Pseudomonadota bacterium]